MRQATTQFIIVGGGSAGSALAGRLTEDPDTTVVLIEAGPRDWNPYIHLPVGYYKTTKGPLTWGYALAPQAHQDNITPEFTQARVLGGGSSINAQVYVRGTAADYDGWAEEGCEGWSYREVLPYFRRAEGNERFAGAYHGTDGPLRVSDQRHTHPLSKAFVQACQEFGMPYNPDFNGAHQAGAGLYQVTNHNGRRCSAAVAYLKAVRHRPNLAIRTGTTVRRLVLENGRAVGVHLLSNGRGETLRAEREVILAAGAIGSPKLLMLSGIGPAAELRAVDVEVRHDLPGVGQNLHDHLDVFMIYDVKGTGSYDVYKKTHRQLWAGLQYAAFRSGPVTGTVAEGGAFWHSGPGSGDPDLQYHFLAGTGVEAVTGDTSTGNGCTLNAYLMHPRSRGTVRLASADPAAAPLIDPNFLAERADLDRTVDALLIGEKIMAQPAMARFIKDKVVPGPETRTRADYETYVRRSARSGYHPVGTCRMGRDDMAVVGPDLRVRGIEGLRVIDASVMPRLVSGNTNAPTIMIAERASDLIRGNRAPPMAPAASGPPQQVSA